MEEVAKDLKLSLIHYLSRCTAYLPRGLHESRRRDCSSGRRPGSPSLQSFKAGEEPLQAPGLGGHFPSSCELQLWQKSRVDTEELARRPWSLSFLVREKRITKLFTSCGRWVEEIHTQHLAVED